MSKQGLPCIDCITLPLCISKYIENDRFHHASLDKKHIIRSRLSQNCSILKEYIYICHERTGRIRVRNPNVIEFDNYFRYMVHGQFPKDEDYND